MLLKLLFIPILFLKINSITMGIDLGGNYIKVAIVTTRKLMETVLDRDSNRKTISAIGFKEGRLVFSDTALNLYRKQPENVVINPELLLGHFFEDISIQKYKEQFQHLNLTRDQDGGILVHFPNFQSFTPVELVAMLLNEIKDYTTDYANLDITDTLISFPPTISQSISDALVSAASLSKINLIDVSDHSRTISTQYIITRKKALNLTPINVMFVDVGSAKTLVTISRVGLEPGIKKNTTVGSFNITGIAFDRIGGSDFDLLLTEMMINDCIKKHNVKKNIRANHRIYNKYLAQAVNAKHVLTASKEVNVIVESACDGNDYNGKIRQFDIVDKGSKIFERIKDTISRAFLSAKMTKDDLSEVIIMGGGSLMPTVQDVIFKQTGHVPSRVLNTDESNSAAASLLAAKAHKFINVAEIKTPANVYYPIEIETNFSFIDIEGNTQTKHQVDLLYPFLSKQSAKKILTLSNVSSDIAILARYGRFPSFLNIDDLDYRNIMKVNISGIDEAIKKAKGYIPRQVVIHFRIDIYRRLTVHRAEYLFERNKTSSIFGKVGQAVMDYFKKPSDNTTTEDDPLTSNTSDANSTLNSTDFSNSSESAKPTKIHENSSKDNLSLPLIVTFELLYLKPPTEESLQESKKKLNAIYEEEKIRSDTIKARSDVDASIYEAERLLRTGEYNDYFTESELIKASEIVKNVRQWFDEFGYSANLSMCKNKSKDIRQAFAVARNRIKDLKDIDNGLSVLNETLNRTNQLLMSTLQSPQLSQLIQTPAGSKLFNLTLDTTQWLNNKTEERMSLNLTETPNFTIGEIRVKNSELDQAAMQFYTQLQQILQASAAESKTKSPTKESESDPLSSSEPSPSEQEVPDLEKENKTIPPTETTSEEGEHFEEQDGTKTEL